MKILEFVFKMGMSVIHILLFTIIAAYIAEFFVTHPVVNQQFDGNPHWGTFLLSAIATLITCAITFATEKDDLAGVFINSVFSRVAVIGVSWPFLRLALHQDSALEAILFGGCALCLFGAGAIGIVGIGTRSRAAGLILYGTAASVFLLFGIYLSGERVLRFDRAEDQVHCTFETYRWFGLHLDDSRQLTNVTGYQFKHQPDLFDDIGSDGVALMSAFGCFVFVVGFIVRKLWQDKAAFAALSDVAAVVEIRDFEILGKVINTAGWYVRIGKPNFGDDDLQKIVPHLEKAPVLWLDLSSTAVTDAGVESLVPVGFIPVLELSDLQITKECQKVVEELAVRHLDIRNTPIRGVDLIQIQAEATAGDFPE